MQETFQNKNAARRRPPRFDLTGGAVCLDFVNTLDDRYSDQPKELIEHYVDLARFGEDTQILSDTQVDRLFVLSKERPEAAQRVLSAAIQMREAMYEVFWALVKKKEVSPTALLLLNQYVQDAAQHLNLVLANGHLEWHFEAATNNLEAPLWPIARSAAELLSSDQVQFVRACASKTCEWLFLDSSKNHRRRWCDMTKCGNRAKFQRFYKRKKTGSKSSADRTRSTR
jgi:predicted RNA-binding Zn ribbon-like protein